MIFKQPSSTIATGFFAVVMSFQIASAQTPPGFNPTVSTQLNTTYGTTAVKPAGITLYGNVVTSVPALQYRSDNSTSYIAILMDFSVAGILPTGNTTLIHWIQRNLIVSASTQSLISNSSAIAPYAPPGPPAGQTHTYGVFLYTQPAEFAVPADYVPFFNNLTASVFNRVGFNLTKFVAETRLGAPVAANWFLVSTPSTTGTGISSASSTNGTGTSPTQFTSEGKAREVAIIGFVFGLIGTIINNF